MKELFDFSNYSRDSKSFCEENKKFIGKMKERFIWWKFGKRICWIKAKNALNEVD